MSLRVNGPYPGGNIIDSGAAVPDPTFLLGAHGVITAASPAWNPLPFGDWGSGIGTPSLVFRPCTSLGRILRLQAIFDPSAQFDGVMTLSAVNDDASRTSLFSGDVTGLTGFSVSAVPPGAILNFGPSIANRTELILEVSPDVVAGAGGMSVWLWYSETPFQ